jgi:hypothetical protein
MTDARSSDHDFVAATVETGTAWVVSTGTFAQAAASGTQCKEGHTCRRTVSNFHVSLSSRAAMAAHLGTMRKANSGQESEEGSVALSSQITRG